MILFSEGEHHIGKPFVPNIQHIAARLSHINRYNGDAGQYSVAQHSYLVSSVLPDGLKLAGLLHDASEAYLGDMTSPLKAYCPEFVKLEQFYHGVIDKHFVIDTRHDLVKEADLRMLLTEVKAFGRDLSVYPDVEPYPYAEVRVEQWHPDYAFFSFMNEYERLIAGSLS